MSSREDTIRALTTFYRQIIRHPYLEESALKIPPLSGWTTIDEDKMRSLGKTDAVIDLLLHLPYLEASQQYERLLIEYETAAIAYTQDPSDMMEEVNPLPPHCVYLTQGLDREGYSLILDTEQGGFPAHNASRLTGAQCYSVQARLRPTRLLATRLHARPERYTTRRSGLSNGAYTAPHLQPNSLVSGQVNTLDSFPCWCLEASGIRLREFTTRVP